MQKIFKSLTINKQLYRQHHTKLKMKAAYLLVAFLALASFASAYDPSPLQDFCVALPDGSIKDAVFVNGKFCKDPKIVVAEDFFKHVDPGNVVNKLGSKVTPVTVNELAGLNTLGISLARIDFGSKGLNPPHTHPRGTEVLIVIEGTLLVGFVTSNQNNTNRLFTKCSTRVMCLCSQLVSFISNSTSVMATLLLFLDLAVRIQVLSQLQMLFLDPLHLFLLKF
ncbi:Germin-like protein subfamily 1 member [Arachis hypogaea]|nr:Germin-like protein subfamily 1 member [Arachis hypogaea]